MTFRGLSLFFILLCCLTNLVFAEMPVNTYSIVARDSKTGELGVAVQSHWFSVGSVVPWAEAGVGAVATQSFVEVSYGPLGLELMKSGKTAEQALKALLAVDETAWRQVAMIDAEGNVTAFTGDKCIAAAGHQMGKNYSVQANLMSNATVWPAMAKAFESASGSLAERMLQALEAGEAAGGDIRGRQSAAILVVSGTKTGVWWKDRLLDLRVEDHPEPLKELRRLMNVHLAYEHANQGDEYLAEGNSVAGLQEYQKAAELLPDNDELLFWAAIEMYKAGEKEKALQHLGDIFRRNSRWRDLVDRLPASDLLPAEAVVPIKAAGQD